MTTKEINGVTFALPYRGRLGCQIEYTLTRIMRSNTGIALYAAMGLRGCAKSYEARYKAAFVRFAEANADKLRPGHVGPKGGWGYKYVGN